MKIKFKDFIKEKSYNELKDLRRKLKLNQFNSEYDLNYKEFIEKYGEKEVTLL